MNVMRKDLPLLVTWPSIQPICGAHTICAASCAHTRPTRTAANPSMQNCILAFGLRDDLRAVGRVEAHMRHILLRGNCVSFERK